MADCMKQKEGVAGILIVLITLIIISFLAMSVVTFKIVKSRQEMLNRNQNNENITGEGTQNQQEKGVQANEFKDNWEAFDAGKIGGLSTKGYFGATYDGRYVYYAPCRTAKFHGIALRYKTAE